MTAKLSAATDTVTVNDTGTWRGHSQSLNLDIACCDRELLFYLPGSDEPLRDLPRAEAALHAERNARQAAETAHRTERVHRRAEQEARQAAERKAAAQAEEITRLKKQLRRLGSSGDGRTQEPPG